MAAIHNTDDPVLFLFFIHKLNDFFDHEFSWCFEASYLEFNLKVYLKAILCAPPPKTCHIMMYRPRAVHLCLSLGVITTTLCPDQTTETPKPDIHTSQSSPVVNTSIANKDDPIFTDPQYGVIFTSGLIRASGDHVAMREFCKARGLTPTLHLVIPPSASDFTAAAVPTCTTHGEQDPWGGGGGGGGEILTSTYSQALL